MSQRDDELIQLLRGELERRAATTPGEGFDMRMQNSVRALERPRHTHRALAAGLAVATVAAVAVALVLGLRAHQGRSTVPAARPTPTSAAGGPVYALITSGQSGVNATPDRVRFVRPDGTVVREVPFPGGAGTPNEDLTVAGSQIFFVQSGLAGGRLFSISPDGVVHDHGLVGTSNGTFTSLAVSPDGRQWVWAERDSNDDPSKARAYHTRLFIAGEGQPTRMLRQDTYQLRAFEGDFFERLVVWNAQGIVGVQLPVGIGGFIPFEYAAHARLVDPRTGSSRSLAGCDTFDDLAADGSYVCANGGDNEGSDGTLTVFDSHGNLLRKITVADPVFAAGDALFSADGKRLAIKVEETDCRSSSGQCTWRTDVVDIASGKVAHAGPAGYAPQAWLPDGSLVLYDALGSQLEVMVTPDGHAAPLSSGDWIGVVHR